MVVWPVTCTLAINRQPSPMTTSGPITQNGPIEASAPMTAPAATRALASIDVIAALPVRDHGGALGLGDELASDPGFAAVPPHLPALRDLGHVVFDRVARGHRLPELRLVDGEEIDVLGTPGAERHHADRARGLRHALDHQHAGKHRIAGEMPEELRLVGGHVLDADGRLVAADLHDAVHHEQRIALRQRLEQLEDIGGAECLRGHVSSSGLSLSRRRSCRTRRDSRTSVLSQSRNGRAGNPPHWTPAGTSVMTPLRAPSLAPRPIVRWSAIPTWPPNIA